MTLLNPFLVNFVDDMYVPQPYASARQGSYLIQLQNVKEDNHDPAQSVFR